MFLRREPQTPAKDSEKDEQPPQKGKDQEEKSQTGADASAKNSETPAKAEERLQEPNKVPFEGGRLNVRVVGDLRAIN